MTKEEADANHQCPERAPHHETLCAPTEQGVSTLWPSGVNKKVLPSTSGHTKRVKPRTGPINQSRIPGETSLRSRLQQQVGRSMSKSFRRGTSSGLQSRYRCICRKRLKMCGKCGGVVFRRSAILPWIITVDKWIRDEF